MTNIFKKIGSSISGFFNKNMGHTILSGIKHAGAVLNDPLVSGALMTATGVLAPELLPVAGGLIGGGNMLSKTNMF
jgi:hypothetical protein